MIFHTLITTFLYLGLIVVIWSNFMVGICFCNRSLNLEKHENFLGFQTTSKDIKLGSVVGPVIQVNGRLSFEDNLRSGGLLYCIGERVV